MAFSRLCRFCLLLACTGAAAVGAGCGEATAEVSGTITIQGKAPNLKGLEIGLLGGNGRLVTAPVNLDGTYKAIGVPVGDVKISLIYTLPVVPHARGQAKSRLLRPHTQADPMPKGWKKEQARDPIPERLQDGSTSKLALKVAPGANNVFNFDVPPY